MQREAYTPNTSASANQTSSSANPFPSQSADGKRPKVHYLCAMCEKDCYLAKDDPLRCHDCGHRIMKKTETKA
ncbi:DNA-directed RNA polymerases I, II, and III subunit RPABC4 [Pseudocercospora fuligena]|uniref:DNA-directed RNA polymerases I, II, and III subunit RPABC4 n=1 Tax=Pseudocercospora fuligena TaxID=685502 RepID=A0A8H6RL93_9PEZI|nr:DNA-directed RNA polymerases I, II, and III subunit RPABC4 [Pseudocercospora fuligena]